MEAGPPRCPGAQPPHLGQPAHTATHRLLARGSTDCPPPPSLPAPAPAPMMALPLLPVQQLVSLPAPSFGLSHRPALLPNPQLAVGSVRTGPGRGDVSSRGGGVMGGVVTLSLSTTMGRAGPTLRVFLFSPAVDPPLSPGVTVQTPPSPPVPLAPPPSEGPLSPSATTPLATAAGKAAVGRGAAVGAARAT
jgi:hypothetical protein